MKVAKKLVSLFLALVMVLSLSTIAMATGNNKPVATQATSRPSTIQSVTIGDTAAVYQVDGYGNANSPTYDESQVFVRATLPATTIEESLKAQEVIIEMTGDATISGGTLLTSYEDNYEFEDGTYSSEQIEKLNEYFRGTNAETAYLLGRHCGLRINECYGLKWDNVDLENGTIFIDRQEQYQNGLIKLVRLKTKNARRTIYLNETMKTYLSTLAKKRTEDEKNLSSLRQQNQKFITDIDGKMISSTELVNCLPNGKIQTVNSMKFHSREIKRLGIADFKFHHLRHTYGTRLAEMNTPEYLLCNQMGHGKIETTHQYYIAISKNGIKTLQDNLNRL